MTERVYVVTLNVPETQLSSVLNRVGTDFLAGVSLGKDLSPSTTPKSPKLKRRARGGSFVNGGMTGKKLVMQILTSGNRAFSRKELMDSFVAHQFSPQSINKSLNDLKKSGRVRFVGEGYYANIPQQNGMTNHVQG
ncbi:MAG TPA: hypothetical protein VFR24_27645 [Candidatus Angelobacter sp.]|nr:hypothetical protein [Candidatus Angelobacter sp.]